MPKYYTFRTSNFDDAKGGSGAPEPILIYDELFVAILVAKDFVINNVLSSELPNRRKAYYL